MGKIDLNYLVLMHCKKKIELNKLIKIIDYIPIQDKEKYIDAYCKEIIKYNVNCSKTYNSIEKYIKGILLIISIYTDIQINGTYEEFDILEKNNLTEEIINCINEYNSFKAMLDSRFHDYLVFDID